MILKNKIRLVVFSILFTTYSTAIAQEQSHIPAMASKRPSQQLLADAVFYDAVRARIKGDDKEATRMFEQFLRTNPNNAAAYYELARLNVKQNNPGKALEQIKKAASLDKQNKWYKFQYAEILGFQSKFEEAAEVYNQLAKTEERNEDYIIKSSLMYQKAGKMQEALAMMDKLLAKSNDNEEYLLRKHQLYLKANDVGGAAKVIQLLIDKNPEEPRYHILLADLYDNNDQSKKAGELYAEIQKKFPDDPMVQYALAEHYRKNNQRQKYEEYSKKAITNKGLGAEGQLALLQPYLIELANDSTRKKEALALAEQIATQHDDNAQVLSAYAQILGFNNQDDKAAEQFKKSLAIDPSQYNTWLQLLEIYSDRKDADSMVLYSEKTLRLFPNQATAHYMNGIGHFNKKNYKSAAKAFQRAIDMQPEENKPLLAQMYAILGDTYQLTKDYELSDGAYDESLKLAPDNASVLNNYSYYLSLRNKRLEDAEKMSKRSLELRPDEPTFLDTYGWILYQSGDYKKAKEYIQKAIDANADGADGTLWEHLGDIYYKLNNKAKAVEYWKMAKEKGTENEQIDKKIQDQKLYE